MKNVEVSVDTHDHSRLKAEFLKNNSKFEDVMNASMSVLRRVLPDKMVVTINSRVKDFDSFYQKSNKLVDGSLKYRNPFEQINDIVGIRIVVIAPRNIRTVCDAVRSSLEILEEEDKAAKLLEAGQLGYESYHLICRLGPERANLREYLGLCELPFEIQVRTALQHSWAENEHRIQYKKTKNQELQKRFLRLAAAISSADEEFDRIYEINDKLEQNAIAAEAEVSSYEVEQLENEGEGEGHSQLSQVSLLFGKKPSQLTAMGRHNEAIQVYDRFISIQPKQASHYAGRAKARALSGDIEGGLSDLKMAHKLSPEHKATVALKSFFDRLLLGYEENKGE